MEKTIKQRYEEWKDKLVEAAVDFAFESQVSSDNNDALNRLLKTAVDITPDVISHIKTQEKIKICDYEPGDAQKKILLIDIREYKEGLNFAIREKAEITISVLITIVLMVSTFACVAWFCSR